MDRDATILAERVGGARSERSASATTSRYERVRQIVSEHIVQITTQIWAAKAPASSTPWRCPLAQTPSSTRDRVHALGVGRAPQERDDDRDHYRPTRREGSFILALEDVGFTNMLEAREGTDDD